MKAKIKRHSRSALSVLLSLCMLVSCMTVGLIGTDAAQTLDAIGASADEASVGADLDKAEDGEESVGAAVDDDESVGDSSSVTIGYDWDGSWKTKSLSKGAEWEVTFSTSKKINFYFQDGSTYYKYDSSQQMPYDSTSQNEFRGHKNGTSDLSFIVQAATYVVKYTGTNDNDLLYFKFYRKADYYLLYSTSSDPSTFRNTNSIVTQSGNTFSTSFVSTDLGMTQGTDYYFALSQKPSGSSGLAFTDIATNITVNATGAIGSYGQQTYDSNKYRFARINLNSSDKLSISVSVNTDTKTYSFSTSSFYTVTVIAGANGTVSVGGETIASGRSKVIEVAQGSNVSATANANNKYEFDEWVVVSPAAVSSTSSATTNISATGSGGTVIAKFKERTSSNHYKATAGSTLNNNNIYSNIKATFFDYYNDNEVIKPGDPSKWITNIGSGKGVIDPDDDGRILAYKTLNQAISDYCYNGGSNSVQYPFYFGCFFGMWNKNVNSYSSNDNQGGVGWNFYHIINDSNKIDGQASLTSANHAISGLTGKTLTKSTYNTTDTTLDKTGMIHYYSASGTNENGKAIPIFDETWLSGGNSKKKELATIIDSPFPVVKQEFYRLYFTKPSGWGGVNAYFYANSSATYGGWPGKAMTKLSGDLYVLDIPKDQINKVKGKSVIFSNSSNAGNEGDTTNRRTGTVPSGSNINDWYNGNTNSWSNKGDFTKTFNYYGFDSTNATDNAYFKNVPTDPTDPSNITIDYYSGKSNGVRARTYNNWGFFPFDWNNRGSSNNAKDMCFGVKLEVDFTLGAGGKINGIDQTFDFSGDDDLWVFVDGNLILDLGGDHKQSTGSINFADKTVTAAKVDNVQSKLGASAVTRNEFPSDFNNNDESVVHKMTIYYLERGMYDSNLKFGFSFVPVSSTYINEKEIDTSAVNAGLKSAVDSSLTNEEFTFTHSRTTVADGETGGGLNGTYSLLPNGTGYTLIDGASQNTRTTSSGQYTLKNTQQAKFVGLDKDRYFQVTEAQSASNKWEYTPELTVWDMENTDSNGVYKTIPVTDVTNDGVTNGGKFKFLTTKSPAHETDATHILGLFTNKIQTKTLNISKVIADGVEDHESEFVIHVRVSLDDGSTFNSYDLDYTNGALKGTLSSGYVSIKNGETIKIDGIPVNAVVEVSEADTTADYKLKEVSVSNDSSSLWGNGIRFTVQNNNTVTFTNEKLYDLKVSKTVTGGDGTEENTYFPFVVEEYDPASESFIRISNSTTPGYCFDNYEYDPPAVTSDATNPDWYFDTTNNYFMVKANKSFTIENIESGRKFLVAEKTSLLSSYSYTTSSITTGATGTPYNNDDLKGYTDITFDDSDIDVTVTNAKDTGKNLKIYKKLTTGSSLLSYKMFIEANGADYSGEYKVYNVGSPDTLEEEEEYNPSTGIEITTSQYILLERIPSGTEIEVTEADYTSSARAYHYAYSMFGSAVGSTSEVTATEGSPKKVDNGIDFTLTNDSVVEVYNKPWGYQIEYAYPGYLKRYGVGGTNNQLYSLSGTFTDQDFTSGIVEAAEVKDDSHDGDLVDGVRFVSAEKESTFITSRAPYQDNFMTLIIWNPVFDDPGSNTHTYFYSGNEAQEIKITIDATVQSQLNCNVYFKLPFDYTISDAGLVPTKSESDGNKIIKVDNKTVNLETQYGKWYTLNNVHTLDDPRGEPQFVEAPGEIYQKNGDGSYTKYVFRYWQMTSVGKEYTGDKRRHALKEAYEYKRCYNSKFNMTFYQDSYVEPIYVVAGSPDDDGKSPSELETLDTAGGMSMINFLENSRNQWNNGGGRNQEFSSRKNEGDRIYCDFLLSFGYNDIALQSSLGKYKTETLTDENGDEYERKTFCPIYYNSDEIHYTGGFVLERVAEMADENDDGAIDEKDILTQAQYISKYGEDTSAATAYIRNGTNTSSGDPRFILNETFSMAAVDNKNQFEYSTSIPNKNDGTGRPYKKYIYRAYTYMRDFNAPATGIANYTCDAYDGGTIPAALYTSITSHNGALIESTVSKPVYFTIYEMASIENGTTYTGGGQS